MEKEGIKGLNVITLVELIYCKDQTLKQGAREELEKRYGKMGLEFINRAVQEKEKTVLLKLKGADEKQVECFLQDFSSDGTLWRVSDKGIMDMYWSKNDKLVEKSKEFMLTAYDEWIWCLIHTRYAYMTGSEHLSEMYSYAVIGVLEAMKDFNPNFSFLTHSQFKIMHQLSFYGMQLQNVSSPHYARMQKMIADAVSYLEKKGEQPTIEKISLYSGYSVKQVRKEMEVMRRSKGLSFEEWQCIALADKKSDINNPFEKVEDEILHDEIRKILSKLGEDTEKIVLLHAVENRSYRDISEMIGIPAPDVRNIYETAVGYILFQLEN